MRSVFTCVFRASKIAARLKGLTLFNYNPLKEKDTLAANGSFKIAF